MQNQMDNQPQTAGDRIHPSSSGRSFQGRETEQGEGSQDGQRVGDDKGKSKSFGISSIQVTIRL